MDPPAPLVLARVRVGVQLRITLNTEHVCVAVPSTGCPGDHALAHAPWMEPPAPHSPLAPCGEASAAAPAGACGALAALARAGTAAGTVEGPTAGAPGKTRTAGLAGACPEGIDRVYAGAGAADLGSAAAVAGEEAGPSSGTDRASCASAKARGQGSATAVGALVGGAQSEQAGNKASLGAQPAVPPSSLRTDEGGSESPPTQALHGSSAAGAGATAALTGAECVAAGGGARAGSRFGFHGLVTVQLPRIRVRASSVPSAAAHRGWRACFCSA